jgi:hypothetical protein
MSNEVVVSAVKISSAGYTNRKIAKINLNAASKRKERNEKGYIYNYIYIYIYNYTERCTECCDA